MQFHHLASVFSFSNGIRVSRQSPGRHPHRFYSAIGRRFIVPALLLLAGVGCSDVAPGNALNQQPVWRLEAYFTGKKIGYRTILDRDGNVREVARIERVCTLADAVQQGSCEDQIHYEYRNTQLTDKMTWSIHYATDTKSTIQYADGFGELTGGTYGSLIVLSGNRRLPATPVESQDRATVEVRMHLRPGPERPVLQTEGYTYFGIEIGTAQTLWLDR